MTPESITGAFIVSAILIIAYIMRRNMEAIDQSKYILEHMDTTFRYMSDHLEGIKKLTKERNERLDVFTRDMKESHDYETSDDKIENAPMCMLPEQPEISEEPIEPQEVTKEE